MENPVPPGLHAIPRHIPGLLAGVMVLHGFLNLATGLAPIFQLSSYLELEKVPEYLQVTPGQKLSGALSILLGILLVTLGKGLYERYRTAWQWAIVVLGLLLVNNLYRGTTWQTSLISLVLIGLLGVFRREFVRERRRRKLEYAEIIAAVSVLFALAYGIVGSYLMRREFNAIEGWTDAVYFTIVTYSTLGYGDILPQTPNAKVFVITMVVIGLSSFVTALTVLLGPLIENRMKGVFAIMTRLQKTIDHVVICGYNHVTESVIDELREHDTAFVLIDDREGIILHLKDKGYDTLLGDPTERATLEQVNLSRAIAVIAATESDSTNIHITLTAKTLRESSESHTFQIVARVEDEENMEKVRNIGADHVISPSTLGGRMMAANALQWTED
jgi:voltage-gated potassium channel